MCSDGLTDVLPDEAIRLTLTRDSGDLSRIASQLVQLANDAGGPDNISVILVQVNESRHRKRARLSGLFGRKKR